ncbi:MAG: bifunctional riboflavin kinase/FAD synthetase [Ferruginibacter sp.]
MQVHHDIASLPFFKKAVITIGTFDGVHTGHLQIINQLKKEAALVDGESVIITFHPHPRKIIFQQHKDNDGKKINDIQVLNTLDERIGLLRNQAIEHLVIVPFTNEFSEQSAEDYIEKFLVSNFHPHTIITGYDHHFGKDRKGNYVLLEQFGEIYNYTVKEIPGHVLNNVAISSTKIREALLTGDVDTANKFLGYDYSFSGIVTEGDRIGRTIGYPTANIPPESMEKLVPANGVYAVNIKIDSDFYKGMMNIGVRPTVGGLKKVIEVNIFNFDNDIYGKNIRIYLKKYLRSEQKFNGLNELRDQLAKDKLKAEII